jgi:hypothetical protein
MTTRGEHRLVRPSTTWYNLKREVVPVHAIDSVLFTTRWYGWYNLLLSLAHTRGGTGFLVIFRKCEGSSEKVVPSVPEASKSLGQGFFGWYNLNSEVVPGCTSEGTA